MSSDSPVSKAVLEALPSSAARAGRALLHDGAVLAAEAEAVEGMQVITGRVRNDKDDAFSCWIGIENDGLDADCSCGAGEPCAHVSAVLLAVAGAGKERGSSVVCETAAERTNPSSASPSAASSGGLVIVLDLEPGPDGQDRLSVAAMRRRRIDGRWIETPYALARARERRQPGYINSVHLEWLRRALDDGALAEDGARVTANPMIDWLPALIEALDCRFRSVRGPRLRLTGSRAVPAAWRTRADGAQRFELEGGDGTAPRLAGCPPLALASDTGACGELHAEGLTGEDSAWLQGRGWVAPEAVETLLEAIRTRIDHCPDALRPASRSVIDLEPGAPVPVLKLEGIPAGPHDPPEAWAVLVFDYGPARLPTDTAVNTAMLDADRGEVGRVRRDAEAERRARQTLEKRNLKPLPVSGGTDARWGFPGARRPEEPWVRLQLARGDLARAGWRIEIEPGFPYRLIEPERWYGWIDRDGLSGDGGEFLLELGAEVDGHRWPLLDDLLAWLDNVPASWLKRLLDTEDPGDGLLLRLDATRMVRLPARQLRAALIGLVEWTGRGMPRDGKLRLPLARISGLAGLEQSWALDGAPDLTGLVAKLGAPGALDAVEAPEAFRAQLRDYQRRGLAWLQLLREHGFGGVLADDMGLGKTLQTLAHLLVEKEAGRMDRPCLIVAPASLLFNWRAEARRFAPDLRLLTLHGPGRKALFHRIADHDLVLTSYALLVRDHSRLAAQSFHIVVLDEAQAIKNPSSASARCARELDARQRLALSGTPLENNLGELWSLFQFVQPGLLGTAAGFERNYRKPIERDKDETRMKVLRHTVAPFLLRRTKAAVAPELPPVVDIERSIELTPEQQRLYEAVRLTMHEKVRRALDERGLAGGRIVVLDALLRLRQICCDPRLIDAGRGNARQDSAKLEVLTEMLAALHDEGRQVLVFSQFTSMLKLIEADVNRLGLDYVKLTGRTRDRERPVRQFQNGEASVFLISLKAGGAGLNLTAAEAVIHYDPWWNPAAEDQATGRAHRIGQTRQVFSWRLVTVGTVEERVLELQQRKRALVDGLFSGVGGAGLDEDDLEALFAPLEAGA